MSVYEYCSKLCIKRQDDKDIADDELKNIQCLVETLKGSAKKELDYVLVNFQVQSQSPFVREELDKLIGPNYTSEWWKPVPEPTSSNILCLRRPTTSRCQDLMDEFSKYGNVAAVTMESNDVAFVTFRELREAIQAKIHTEQKYAVLYAQKEVMSNEKSNNINNKHSGDIAKVDEPRKKRKTNSGSSTKQAQTAPLPLPTLPVAQSFPATTATRPNVSNSYSTNNNNSNDHTSNGTTSTSCENLGIQMINLMMGQEVNKLQIKVVELTKSLESEQKKRLGETTTNDRSPKKARCGAATRRSEKMERSLY